MKNVDWDLVRWEQNQLVQIADIENDQAEAEREL